MIKLLMVFLVAFIFSEFANADVYKYKDKSGKIHYTDSPPNKNYKRIIRTKVVVRLRNNDNTLGRLSSFSKKGFSKKGSLSRKEKARYSRISHSAKANRKKYSHFIANAAKKYNVDQKLVHAVILAESAYNPNAVSPVGAVGLMQLMPATARRFGVTNRNDPQQSIDGGTHYLKILLKMFNSNMRLAVAGYNAGEGAVRKYNNTIPPYKETRNYVKKVLAYYQG
ncbi:MAG: lytic transglycosylase domain-containing protein [Methylococcales bacterium]|nr:lytic transglycosylase domain-containing protein [Methylococcales bacterium]